MTNSASSNGTTQRGPCLVQYCRIYLFWIKGVADPPNVDPDPEADRQRRGARALRPPGFARNPAAASEIREELRNGGDLLTARPKGCQIAGPTGKPNRWLARRTTGPAGRTRAARRSPRQQRT